MLTGSALNVFRFMFLSRSICLAGILLAMPVGRLFAQGAAAVDAAWLRYSPISEKVSRERYAHLPAVVVELNDSPIMSTARSELIRGVRRMLGRTLRTESKLPKESAIVLGTMEAVQKAMPSVSSLPELAEDGFWLKTTEVNGKMHLLVTSPNERGVLYGAMHVLRKMALGESLSSLNEKQMPYQSLRLLRHADHLDGTVDRGYAGRSIFWEAGHAQNDLRRVHEYARLMASLGINGCVINHERGDARILSTDGIRETARIADLLRPWGVRVFLAVDMQSPQAAAGRPFDPVAHGVAKFWVTKAGEIYRTIPDLGGFAVTGVAAGRVVPWSFGRTHAEAANVIAQALAPHGGLLLYVTTPCADVDSSDAEYDLARAACDQFQPLDGHFAENVILQTNLGPGRFQIREPPAPLFTALTQSNQLVALSLAQEYSGQQRHVCYLAPAWKSALDFDLRTGERATTIKQIAAGLAVDRPHGGMIAEAAVGRSEFWLAHPLAVANLYAAGRLAWNPDLGAKAIAEDWARLTFGHDPLVVGTVVDVLMKSRRIYENCTGPLGAGAATDAVGYGPRPGAVRATASGWGFADRHRLGFDRTLATGSGFVDQYPPALADVFESPETCPSELLLFFHHLPYTHVLKSGKTVIQHLYDAHYQGARDAARMVDKWRRLQGSIDDARYQAVLTRLEYQAGHAQVWRDTLCNWLARKSGIEDGERRVGKHPGRIEAEKMQLDGYEVREAVPWDAASGGAYAACVSADGHGRVSWKYSKKPGWVDISVWYFDENDGESQFRLLVGDEVIDEWSADDSLPSDEPDGHTATRHQITSVALRPGDQLTIEAIADGGEEACLDYVEFTPAENP
jgi:alpha-glucuronidase